MDRQDWIDQFQDGARQSAPFHPLQNFVVTREGPRGARLSATVSPCVWLYDSTLQISVTLVGGGTTIVSDTNVRLPDITEADVVRLLDTVRLKKCTARGCHNPAFDPAFSSRHRDGKCEQCFLTRLGTELEKLQEAEKKNLAKMDRFYMARGFTHRADTWIHADGGDQQLSVWLLNPTDRAIRDELVRAGADAAQPYTLHPL